MVAVVRGLREAGLAVTLLDGNRHYTLLPNTSTQPAPTQRTPPITIVNTATQQCPPKYTADTSTEPAAIQCDRDAQAVDGRYTSMYKAMHCNMRPTSPPVQLTEFPPQRPELCPGHGNFIVGGAGSGANSDIRPSSPSNSFRGGMCWPDRGSVCSPRPARMVDAFARSLRKYPACLSPDRSSEVMERLINYTQPNKTRSFRNSPSPSRISEPSPHTVLEPKPTFVKSSRNRTYEPDVTIRPKKSEDPTRELLEPKPTFVKSSRNRTYEPDVTIRPKKSEDPTRERKKEEERGRSGRGYDVRCLKDVSRRMREDACAYTSYPYNHPVCPPTIIETHDYHPLSCDYQNSSNSVNMDLQAAVKMLSKEVATAPRGEVTRETVAIPEASIPTTTEDYVEGEFYYVENLDITTSIKSIQTNIYPSDITLKPRKSAQTVFSTIDFHSSRNRTIVSRKTKSEEEIKLTKDELKISLLELINEITDSVSKNAIRDELIKKLFMTDNIETNDHKNDRVKKKHDKIRKYDTRFTPAVSNYVGEYQDLLGKLKHCFDGTQQVLRSEVKPFRQSEYRQLDFVIKDWVNQLNIKNCDRGMYVDRNEVLHTVEDRIKDLFTNWTKQDFDLRNEIVEILEEIPIKIHKSYNKKSYLRKLVDVLLKRMRNVVVSQQSVKTRKKPFANRSRKILTEEDMRDFIRAHLVDFFDECNIRIRGDTYEDLENELVDLMMDSLDCIWCGHDDAVIDEMNIILQDVGKVPAKQANYLSNTIIEEMLHNCAFNQTYTILNVSNNTGPYMDTANSTAFSIGSINEDDLQSNLDRYTNQLCLQINQWLDTLDIPRIQDSGFREVVVNDLAGDIVDRHKYIELNHTGRDTEEDQLEALKYQIFKWINKLVGDDNQETISHAETLLQMINSIPVPMLVNPQHRNSGPCCDADKSMCPRQASPKPYSPTVQGLNQSRQCCGNQVCPNSSGQGYGNKKPCCEIDDCPNESASKPQGVQGQPEFVPHHQSGLRSYDQGPQNANAYHSHQGQSIPNNRGETFGPASPNNPWGSNTFSTGFEPSQAGNLSQLRNQSARAGRTGSIPGRPFGAIDQSNNGCCHNFSPTRPGVSIPVKKLNEDYDEFLKKWVKMIPLADLTAAEKQAAETARLAVYNGIWKGVTKMKLDPNVFAHQYYCLDVLEEDIERLLNQIPQSQALEEAKPMLKAQLLQKTLAMNDLIKSTNAPASFKQQLIDNIENNLPKRKPIENKADKDNDELEKQNLAEYYILYSRYKDEDSVKATIHKKNFLKKLDEFLNKIKNRDNILDMDTNVYATEIINSFDKIPTPSIFAIKDEADDILLAMEVENWVSDIPLKSDTVGPLEKRRTRDAIVKKINDIGADVSCCDDAFRVPLKAELPKYLEKLPIQDGTNVEYLVDELANRIRNLAISSMRRVSFQEPQNYEEFGANMPAASSMLEMSEDRSSYMVIGGDIVKDPGPRRPRWVREQTPVNEDDIAWLSLDKTQIPSIMRSGPIASQGRQSPAVYNPNQSGQMSPRPRSPQVFVPNASGRYFGDIPQDTGPKIAWENERAPVPQKRQRLSTPERQMSPNMGNRSGQPAGMQSQVYNPNESLAARSPGPNFGASAGPRADWVSNQEPPQEESQWVSLQRTQIPPQMRSGSVSPQRSQIYCPNASNEMATQRGSPIAQQVHDQFPHNAQASFVPNSEVPFVRNVQGHFTSFESHLPSTGQNQMPLNVQGGELCTGPPCCPNPLCNTIQDPVRSEPTSYSPGSRGPSVQRSPDSQGMPCCDARSGQTSPIPQRFSGHGSPDRYNQSFGQDFGSGAQSIQNASGPANQMQPQGPRSPRQSQGLHGSNVQDYPNIKGAQNYSIPNNQGQSFGSRLPSVDPGRSPYQESQQTSLSIGLGFGPYFGKEMNRTQDQVDQEPCCQGFPHVPGSLPNSGQASIYGVIQGSGQGYLDDQHNPNQTQPSVYGPVMNQSLQNPGQLPNQAPRPFNLQKMTGAGMGLLGVSQVPGPSTRSVKAPTSSAPNGQCCPISGVQGVGAKSIQRGVMYSDDRGMQRMIDQGNDLQQPCCADGQAFQAVCIPPSFLSRPEGCSSPDRDREKERCKCLRQGRKFRPRMQMDPNDDQVEYQPCTSVGKTRPTHNKPRIDRGKELAEKPKTNKIKPSDINEREVFNYKSVQTASSSLDITTTKCMYCEVRSKSQDELVKTMNTQEVVKKSDLGCGDLLTEWFEIHSDKVKVKLWGEKMKRLAEKLKRPGGEEKLRSKIEKYLNKAPEKHSEVDNDILEFRKQLPNDIIRKLKKMYLCPKETNLISVYRMELPRYSSRSKVDNFRKTVLNWTKALNIKKKDFLGRNVKKDDVFKYVADKLEPLVLDRPRSDSEYKIALQSNISELVYELPLALSSHNKDFYLNKNNSVVQSMVPLNTEKINNNTKPYIDKLTEQIYDWYCNLNTDLHISRDATLNKLMTKALAEDIEKGVEKEDGIIDEKVNKWAETVFKDKISKYDLQQLKNSISNVPYTKDNRANDLKYEKTIIRAYEDIVDEWIDRIPITPKRQEIFANNKNEIVHSVAVKILKIKNKTKHLTTEVIEKKLEEELSHWLKKLPLHVKIDSQNDRDKYAADLVKEIQRFNVDDSLRDQQRLMNNEPVVIQLEKLIRGWLKKLPLFKDKTPEENLHQETIIKELTHKLNQLKGYEDLDEVITKHIRMLDSKQNDEDAQNMAFHLKLHLEKFCLYKDLCKQYEKENAIFVDTIESWLNGLPLNVTDTTRFNKQKTDLIKTVKRLISSGSDNSVMKKEMLMFARTLPMSHAKKYDLKYLSEEVMKLLISLKLETSADVDHQAPIKSVEMINDVIRQWVRSLPLKPGHCPRELRSFIDDMSSVISTHFLNRQHNSTQQNDAKLHREITKFLRRFPLVCEMRTESHIFRMAKELSKTLQNPNLIRSKKNTMLNNVTTVYGVSLESKVGNTTTDYSIQSIKTSDINQNMEAYTKQLIHVIGEWFDRLNLPESHQEGFKEVVINDLAGDIVDRHKYLELNPNNRGSEKDELEHLKYQIFKWINKLVGEENSETIGHAEELMQMINRIPVPMLVKPQDKTMSRPTSPQQRSQRNTLVGHQNNSQPVNSPIRQSENTGVSNRGSPSNQQASSSRIGSFSGSANRRKPCCSQVPPPAPPPPDDGTKEAMYEKYVTTFKDLCNAIPIDESTPEYALLAKQARQAIYNAILKTFFNLKSDPKLEHDYRLFEFVLEETIDELLDVLPQTEELKKVRYSWKVKVLEEAINMLEDLHKLSDSPGFRQTVRDKFNRQFAIDNELQHCFVLQQGFLSSVADAYILETNYKEKDPIKANIYKNRLMKEIDKLVNHMVKVHNVGFRFFDRSKLARITMKTLEKVPIPNEDILQDEVEEILLTDEIEKWYKELPTTPLEDEMDGVVRRRMIDLLAKKLHEMHKQLSNDDSSKEEKMKHEMSQFLEKKGNLQQDQDLNINFMVDQLHYRLKNRWLHIQEPGAFEEFDKAKPLSSTLAHVDNAEFLDPLMEVPTSNSPGSAGQRSLGDQGYFIQPGQQRQSMGQVSTSYGGAPYSAQGVPGSPRKALFHSLDPNLLRQVPYGTRMSPGRANVSQQGDRRLIKICLKGLDLVRLRVNYLSHQVTKVVFEDSLILEVLEMWVVVDLVKEQLLEQQPTQVVILVLQKKIC
ncbi:hypothetical protein PYW07_011886 [Mythimna separata]|uniref:Uncharacterized protein n=1 Tax=Mythimna separata TaxID=271217 RepID=A0AAD7Y753_MYTSE|nr:hypothetical protein PYW07_011886 [Mythimna separata]